jgi:membrane protein implicated in regulation of membrane protease activity
MLKYSLARVGLFAVVAAILFAIPVQINPLLKLMIAVIVSALLALFLLRGMRNRVAEQMAGTAQRRADEKARLRAALAGDEDGKDKDADGDTP